MSFETANDAAYRGYIYDTPDHDLTVEALEDFRRELEETPNYWATIENDHNSTTMIVDSFYVNSDGIPMMQINFGDSCEYAEDYVSLKDLRALAQWILDYTSDKDDSK